MNFTGMVWFGRKMAVSTSVVNEGKASTSLLQQLGNTCDCAGKMAPNLEKEFVRLKGVTYLDHAGATLYADSQMKSIFSDLDGSVYGNPHSRNPSSQLTSEAIDHVRFRVLQFFNTTADEYDVVFTSGATAAIKLVGECLQWNKEGLLVYMEDNHTSVLGLRALAAAQGAQVQCISNEQLEKLDEQVEGTPVMIDTALASGDLELGLFIFPAESNFCGCKYPLEWIEKVQAGVLDPSKKRRWFCLLDVAALVATSPLDLAVHRPDFASLSFYKMFGFPTGVGALLVSRRAVPFMRKTYYGGGTVLLALPGENLHVPRPLLHDSLEDGTLPFLDILAVRHGLDTLLRLSGGMQSISEHTFALGRYVYDVLSTLHHANGQPVAEMYCRTGFRGVDQQGAIVTFNLLRADGSHVGFAQVEKVAALHDIHLRTGCFCNPGACSQYLKLSRDDLLSFYQAGHVCGDDRDLVAGNPTGAVRVSFGYMSTKADADRLLSVIGKCFVDRNFHCRRPGEFVGEEDDEEEEEEKKQEVTHPALGNERLTDKADSCNCHLFEDVRCHGNHLTNIFVYPIKSCGAFEVSSWSISDRGLTFDREWVVVNAAGVSLTQKREPRLCLIHPKVDLDRRCLWLHCEGGFPAVSVDLDVRVVNGSQVSLCNSRVCGDSVTMLDCGDEVSDWISKILGQTGCRLLRHHPDNIRKIRLRSSTDTSQSSVTSLSLANQSQFLLLSRSSVRVLLDDINGRRHVDDGGGDDCRLSVENLVRRFRANFVITGKEAYGEDIWGCVRIGRAQFEVHGCCSRCQMVSIDQDTACKSKEPLLTLAATRGHKIPFGVHLYHNSSENQQLLMSVGDPVFPNTID